MTVAVTTLRQTIATALENSGVWSVYSFPPASPTANSVIVQTDDPYLEPSNGNFNTVGPTANFIITMIVPMFDNQGNLVNRYGNMDVTVTATWIQLAWLEVTVTNIDTFKQYGVF